MNVNEDYSGNVIGKYKLIKKLGNGNFGSVYLVHDEILNTDKALKLLQIKDLKKAKKLFLEAEIPYKCNHKNIIEIYGGEILSVTNTATHVSELLFAIDMELINGLSVEKLLTKQYLTLDYSLKMIQGVLFGLEHSHNQGIIHRDIKPGNILIDNKIPKLSDFGLASSLGALIDPPDGYIPHMAPETIDNNIATIESDIYALGITFYRMINNISNWQEYLNNFFCSIDDLNNDIISGQFIKKLNFQPYIPEKVKKIIKKACALNPSERYHSAAEMRNAIAKLHTNYEWNKISDLQWQGINQDKKKKELTIEEKGKIFKFIVKNNNRKSSAECHDFTKIEDAISYMNNYIKDSLLK